jgi:hypothetical protein
VWVLLLADAVVHPWTVVVEMPNAFIAELTVLGAGRPERLAVEADVVRVEGLVQAH